MRLIKISESSVLTHYDEHSHSHFEISLVLCGTMSIKIDDKIYNVTEGDVVIIPPGITHQGVLGIGYVDTYIHCNDLDLYNHFIINDYDGSIKSLFMIQQKVVSEKESNYKNISEKILESIYEFIKKYIKTSFKYDFVVDIKNKIYENISNSNFSISQEIKNIGFNTDYFRRCFREEMGCTPLEYIIRLRIERAKNLLTQNSFESVEKVAYLCGFSDSFYFSKIFKKNTGISPRDYRKQSYDK